MLIGSEIALVLQGQILQICLIEGFFHVPIFSKCSHSIGKNCLPDLHISASLLKDALQPHKLQLEQGQPEHPRGEHRKAHTKQQIQPLGPAQLPILFVHLISIPGTPPQKPPYQFPPILLDLPIGHGLILKWIVQMLLLGVIINEVLIVSGSVSVEVEGFMQDIHGCIMRKKY